MEEFSDLRSTFEKNLQAIHSELAGFDQLMVGAVSNLLTITAEKVNGTSQLTSSLMTLFEEVGVCVYDLFRAQMLR